MKGENCIENFWEETSSGSKLKAVKAQVLFQLLRNTCEERGSIFHVNFSHAGIKGKSWRIVFRSIFQKETLRLYNILLWLY